MIRGEITIKGAPVTNGDPASIGVVFNNLSGANFANPEAHAAYLEYVAKIYGLKDRIHINDDVEVYVGGARIACCGIGSCLRTRFSAARGVS